MIQRTLLAVPLVHSIAGFYPDRLREEIEAATPDLPPSRGLAAAADRGATTPWRFARGARKLLAEGTPAFAGSHPVERPNS